ncbi:MAG: type II toxin-antitoxin system VapC family toxin [Thiohalocapsa sp.]
MKLIVDTCTFLWLASAEEKLSDTARALLEDSGNILLLSAASVWEIGVKHALGRLPLPENLTPTEFIPEARSRNGVDALPITEDDPLQLGKLPCFHQDPFDRMLICQAISNQAVLVTPDPLIARYPVSVQW